MNNIKTNKTVIFTGGGSGGHVIPAITLIRKLRGQNNIQIRYIGSVNGIEYTLITKEGIPFKGVSTGKLRRYFSLQNLTDIFRIVFGFMQCLRYLLAFSRKNTLLFSCGGFVSVPVVWAARLLGIKVYVHEQTSRVGLANKLASKVATKVLVSFQESLKFFPPEKTQLIGYPLREEIFTTQKERLILEGIDLMRLDKPILFVTGGGNGARILNEMVKKNFATLCEKFFIIHQTGKDHLKDYISMKTENYLPIDFVPDIISVMKESSVVVSRAGAGTVCELLALGKKSIFIPLKIAQKNEQYFNAKEAQEKIGSVVITEDDFNKQDWPKLLWEFHENKAPSKPVVTSNPTDKISSLITKELGLA